MTLAARITAFGRTVALDLTPLRISRDYRLVYIGQSVSFLGSMITYVAVPYQMYSLDAFDAGSGSARRGGADPAARHGPHRGRAR